MKKKNILMLTLLASLSLPAAAQQDSTGISFADQVIEVGANKDPCPVYGCCLCDYQ